MEITKARHYFFIGSLAVVSILLLYIMKPFFYPLFWAAVIASLFYPLYKRLNTLLDPNLSASLTLLIVTVIVILPFSLIAMLLVREIVSVVNSYGQTGQISGVIHDISNFIQNNDSLQQLGINETVVAQRIDEIGRAVIAFIYQLIKSLTQNSLEFVVLFVLMLYTLFFFLRDGAKIMKKIMYLLPLGSRYEQMLYEKFTSAASATIKGTVIVGLIQGTLGGLLFWFTGVPGALIWGIVMAALATIPVTGTYLVWLPVALIKIATGQRMVGLIIM